jgi:methylmalonyl-CoA mutase N-terminal domain/subunit
MPDRVEPYSEKRRPSMPERKEQFTTVSGIPVERTYTHENSGKRDLSEPGEYPFVRGVHASGYRSRLWTMRMFAGFGTAEDTNQRFKYLLEQGQTGLSCAFDMPTLYGYDTDHPMAQGEFGRCGVAVSSLADMEILFDGIPLDQVTTSMTINAPAAIIWAMYIAVAEGRGIAPEALGGTIQNDIIKEFTAQNEYIFPLEPSMRLVIDTIEYATAHLPRWNPISISGYHIREAGSNAVQELAFTLADGFEYVESCLARGMDIDDFAPRLSFFFNVHQDFFEEIAKIRAARRIWAREMKERFGAKQERSWWMRTHAQTAGVTLTSQQPENNIVRVSLQALGAVLSGVQSLHTNGMDEALALPSEEAALMALRTQQIIAHEPGVTDTVDPLGGSHYLEWLTDQLEEQAYEYFRRIDDMGGVRKAVEDGFLVGEIADEAERFQHELDNKERVTVGVTDYVTDEEIKIPLMEINADGERHHLERLNHTRAERDNQKVSEALAQLRQAARGTDNMMPAILSAVKTYATLGEMMQVLKDEWGEYQASWF